MQPINHYLDHAVLKPELTQAEARAAILMGVEYRVRTVCVRPCDIALASDLCQGTATGVCTVLSFPHGCLSPLGKEKEAELYLSLGVDEVDMVANYGLIRSGEWDWFEEDVATVREVLKPGGVILKVILETALLDLEQIRRATRICRQVGADFVKTSTGFNGGGATEEAVRAMLEEAAGQVQVKPSGGIRDAERARLFIEMGAQRLGVGYNSTPAICSGSEGSTSDSNSY